MDFRKIKKWTIVVGLLAGPITLLLLPKDYFDTGESVCLSKSLLDMECYACGMTRAIMHLIHFDFSMAASFNKLSFVVLPVLGVFWVKIFLKQFNVHILKWW